MLNIVSVYVRGADYPWKVKFSKYRPVSLTHSMSKPGFKFYWIISRSVIYPCIRYLQLYLKPKTKITLKTNCILIIIFDILQNRELLERLEELETENNHLLKRFDKLKNAKSALLKDLWPKPNLSNWRPE